MDLIMNSYVIELAWIVGKIMLVVGPLLIAVALSKFTPPGSRGTAITLGAAPCAIAARNTIYCTRLLNAVEERLCKTASWPDFIARISR